MITLDTIIKFAGTDKMLVNAQGTGFESVGIAQRLKSFFNIGDARKRNIDTMSAIRGAIYNDPRFRTADLSEHVQRLLDEVSTDRAIDATRIKSIAKELKSLADRDSTAALDKRVELHLAAGVLPDELRGCVEKHMDQVLFIAKQRTRKVADDVATAAIVLDGSVDTSKLVVDVAGSVMDVARHCQSAIYEISQVPDANTKNLVDFIGKHLNEFVLKEDGTLCDYQKFKDAREFCRLAVRGGHQSLHENTIAEVPNEFELMEPYETAAMEFLVAANRPVKPALYDKIEAATRSYVTDNLVIKDFNAAARDQTIDSARLKGKISFVMRDLMSAIDSNANLRPFFRDASAGNDVKAFEALGRYMAKLVALRLPADVREEICAKLNVQSAEEAFESAARVAIANELY